MIYFCDSPWVYWNNSRERWWLADFTLSETSERAERGEAVCTRRRTGRCSPPSFTSSGGKRTSDVLFCVLVKTSRTFPSLASGFKLKQQQLKQSPKAGASFAGDLCLKQPLLVLRLLKVRRSASVGDRDGPGAVAERESDDAGFKKCITIKSKSNLEGGSGRCQPRWHALPSELGATEHAKQQGGGIRGG